MTERDKRRGLPSASSMARLKECSGSLFLTNALAGEGKWTEQYNADADAGTRIHLWLKLKWEGKPTEGILKSRAELDTAEKCEKLRDIVLKDWIRATYSADEQPVLEFLLEHRWWYRSGLWPRFSGQLDFAAIDRANRRALILDYKTGRKESEEASDNLQLRTLSVLEKHNEPEIEDIEAGIIEPWVSWDPVRVKYGPEAKVTAEREIVSIVDQAEWFPERRLPGRHCVHCPARAYCREASEYAQLVPNPDAMKNAIEELPRGERGVVIWERIKVAEKLLETLKKTYKQILEQEPNALPGYILPERGKSRKYVPFPAKLKSALSEFLTPEEIDGAASFHLEKVKEVLGLKHHLEGKELDATFEKLTKGAVYVSYDASFIRPMTKKERDMAGKLTVAREALSE